MGDSEGGAPWSGRGKVTAGCYSARVRMTIRGEIWFWRGPSPFHFVTIPKSECAELRAVAPLVTYGWGVIPVVATIGATTWPTSLFPKEGGYLVPVKASVRKAEKLEIGEEVRVTLVVNVAREH